MNCPRCQAALAKEQLAGIEVEHCPNCNGRWLDHHELDLFEAQHAPQENDRKGMIEYAKRPSDLNCPTCGKQMTAFNYRANPLELDSCDDDHGWWLDGGEAGKVGGYIEQRVQDLYRSATAEQGWTDFLGGIRKSFSKR